MNIIPNLPLVLFAESPQLQKKIVERIQRLEQTPRVHSPEEAAASAVQMTSLTDIDRYFPNVVSILSTICTQQDACPSNLLEMVVNTIAKHFVQTLYLMNGNSYMKAREETELFFKEGGAFVLYNDILVEKIRFYLEYKISMEQSSPSKVKKIYMKHNPPESN